MDKTRRSFRLTMVLLFGISMGLSGTITYLVYRVLQSYYHTTQYEDPSTQFRRAMREIGDVNVFLIILIPMSFYIFFLLTKRYANYFREISAGIHQLANGNFDNRIRVPTNDEFGSIARDVNLASEKLQQALERGDFAENSKEQLVLNLAHDLRTPLTSVIGYLDYLLRDEELTGEQKQHYMTIAYTKAQRLEKLIDELFGIARMNYGKLTIEKTAIHVGELLAQLTEELYPAFEKNNLLVRLHLSPNLTTSGDGELLARVFENLLTNANRYGKDGRFIDIHGSIEGDEVVVQVINYGSRIAPEDLTRVFEMFYTGDQARTHSSGSTGLGLFIAKNIIEQHGGAISAQSDLIRTSFEVRLPYRADEAE